MGACLSETSIDLGEARRFLDALDPEAETFTFQTFTDAKSAPKPDPLARVQTGTLDACADWLTAMNRRGAGVFVTVNETDGNGRKERNITRVRAVWQEDDGAGQPLPIEPHIVVESSPGHWHRYLLVDGLTKEEHREAQERMVASYGSDPNAKDVSRVMRVPGFLHQKGEPFRVRLAQTETCLPYSRDQIFGALSAGPRQASPAAPTTATEYADEATLRDLRSALTALRADERELWIAVGSALRGLGDAGRALWLEWSQTSPKWEPRAAQTWDTLRNDRTGFRAVFTRAQAAGWVNPLAGSPAAATKPRTTGDAFTWGDDMTSPQNLRPSEWTIRKVLPTECTGLVYGAWGTCKTFVLIDMAGCIANGIDWHGKKTQAGTVFYLAGEGHGGFARRMAAWEAGNGASMARVAFRTMPEVRKPDELAAVADEIERLASERGTPRLIVLDTLFTALDGGDENSGRDMGEVFRAMRDLRDRFRCAVIAVHHTGHDGDRARGHSSMPAGVDVQFFLKRKKGPGDSTALELANPKQKDGKEHAPLFLTTELVPIPGLLDEEGEQESSLVIRAPTADMVAAMQAEKDEGESLDSLKAKAADLRRKGMTFEQIGEVVGRDKGTVSRWFKEGS